MIKVNIAYKGKDLQSIEIKGHANSGDYGVDLVCAGVSAITVGALNALEESDSYEIEVEEGYLSIDFPKSISEHDETVMETMIIQLKTIEESYHRNIEIKERKN